ncbi:heat-inducible transcriptional repressor HrcA [Tumebacillus permanentifrigoris]|uniref:Heat-inducible transcription repressor HrcA n=1 Tax=Tumebacillus permanentifrigoris TaxID=378543 RepID=A0A316D5B1_9BACL|nr:heat-inducible transcriptional repressor HrcA [Tumebacillus permanentifrigoris]PWK08389.1 heat-inducible transcription repressor HrcA [Tumebacillus permanentifrigoris]
MLTDRQKVILQVLVDDYIRSAEPVGSRTISKRPDMSISPATIRNEMADLEELGYLEQPHTSAGRIPSQKGYRFYVDHLMNPDNDEESSDVSTIRSSFLTRLDEMEQVVQQTATILSSLTNYTAIVLGPQVFTTKLHSIQLQLLSLETRMAVAIIVTDNGHVESRKVMIPEGLPPEALQHYVELLNRKLVGVPLHKLKMALHTEVADELRRYSEQFEGAMMLFDQMVEPTDEAAGAQKIYLGGATRIMNQPEFRDVEKLKPLLDMFEQTQKLLRMLEGTSTGGVQVRIGQENAIETIHECSLVTASYTIDGIPVGAIGVLGPTRMEYGRVIHTLHQFSSSLSHMLTQLYK